MYEQAKQLIEKARQKQWRFGFAESCTGGALAYACVRVPCASDAFYGGVVPYAKQLKIDLCNLSLITLEKEGQVSCACATEMALSLLKKWPIDFAVATTGSMGPLLLEQSEKGELWTAIAFRDGEVHTCRIKIDPALDRPLMIEKAAQMVLEFALCHI